MSRGAWRPVAAGFVAAAIAAATVWTFVRGAPLLLPLSLHVLAAVVAAAGVPRDLRVYRHAVLVGAAAVPVLGPALAWLLLARPARPGHNAHAWFVDQESAGDADDTFAHQDDDPLGATMSFHEVLRHGSLDHRRNALRKLAERGQPMHLALLRRCLSHPDMELRLGAFREVNRLLERWEARIARLGAEADAAPDDPSVHQRLSLSHREFATSGLLDRETQRLQLEMALARCKAARLAAPRDTGLAVEQAMVYIALEDLAGAERTLATVVPSDVDRPDLCAARAQLAFRLRRFDAIAAEVDRLEATASPVPAWMRELEVVS